MTTALTFEGTSFPPGSGLNGERSIPVTKLGLVWAATTVGYPRWATQQWRGYGVFHLLARIASVLATLEVAGPSLRTTRANGELDATERAWHTYSLGMTLARWVSYVVFDIWWLQHLDRAPWDVQTQGRRRPDLIGWGRPRWCVVEAKGRQRGPLRSALRSGKTQASAVLSVNGRPPTLGLSMVSKLARAGVKCMVMDPPPDGDLRLRIEEDLYLRSYYSDILDLLRGEATPSPSTRREGDFVGTYLPAREIWIGVREGLFEALLAPRPLSFDGALGIMGAPAEGQTEAGGSDAQDVFVGPDGIAVGREPL